MQFLPILRVIDQDRGRQAVLRKNVLQPYDVFYLGNCGALGESFTIMSEAYPLAAGFFAPEIREWSGHPEVEEPANCLTLTKNDTRIGRLEDAELDLLHTKLNAFWTRRLPRSLQP
jgi:hypothetical protein